MKVTYDFRCRSCKGVFDEHVESGTYVVSCSLCMDSLADQVWLKFPGVDTDEWKGTNTKLLGQLAANGIRSDSRHEAMRQAEEKGMTIYDRGCSRDAKRNFNYKLQKQDTERHNFIERMVLDENYYKEQEHKVKEAETIDK